MPAKIPTPKYYYQEGHESKEAQPETKLYDEAARVSLAPDL